MHTPHRLNSSDVLDTRGGVIPDLNRRLIVFPLGHATPKRIMSPKGRFRSQEAALFAALDFAMAERRTAASTALAAAATPVLPPILSMSACGS